MRVAYSHAHGKCAGGRRCDDSETNLRRAGVLDVLSAARADNGGREGAHLAVSDESGLCLKSSQLDWMSAGMAGICLAVREHVASEWTLLRESGDRRSLCGQNALRSAVKLPPLWTETHHSLWTGTRCSLSGAEDGLSLHFPSDSLSTPRPLPLTRRDARPT